MFLAVSDHDHTKKASAKVMKIVERYREVFGVEPDTILTSYADVADLEREGELPESFTVKPVSFIGRHHFYVGVDDGGQK